MPSESSRRDFLNTAALAAVAAPVAASAQQPRPTPMREASEAPQAASAPAVTPTPTPLPAPTPPPRLTPEYVPSLAARPFDIHSVRVRPGIQADAMAVNRKYMMGLSPDRLLHNFRVNAGLPSTAQPLGGWEAPLNELRGHFTGHYLSGTALFAAHHGDDEVRARGALIVSELARVQAALGGGYLSAFPLEFFDRLKARVRVWAHHPRLRLSMKPRSLAAFALSLLAGSSAFAQTPPFATTPAGIPLDAPWKESVFKFATEKLQHSAWGVSHSERDYLLASRLSAESKLEIDTDVLFAAAFLHDVGAFDAFRKEGVDHTDRAADLVPDILAGAGFPAAKVEAVQDAVRNHMYYRANAGRPEAIVLHDADTLDFLGNIGIARILSLTTRHRWATDLRTAAKTLEGFNTELPPKLMTNAAKKIAPGRVAESKAFLESLKAETEDGRAR